MKTVEQINEDIKFYSGKDKTKILFLRQCLSLREMPEEYLKQEQQKVSIYLKSLEGIKKDEAKYNGSFFELKRTIQQAKNRAEMLKYLLS